MIKYLSVFLIFTSLLLATTSDTNATVLKKQMDKEIAIKSLKFQLRQINDNISEEKVWTKSYSSYLTLLNVKTKLKKMQARIKKLKRYRKTRHSEEVNSLESKVKMFTMQMKNITDAGNGTTLFANLITPPDIGNIPKVSNPFDIFSAMSYIKQLTTNTEQYIQQKDDLGYLITQLQKALEIYSKLITLDKKNRDEYKDKYKNLKTELDRFQTAYDTIKVASEVYQKRFDIAKANTEHDIHEQIYKLAKLGIIILIVFIVFLLLKFIVKKYITDNERFYMANKIITFINFTLIILIIFFNYIENASYLVTILGFASAGIAIAMKDWFMSLLGWLVIVFGGSIHVGDRIRVDMGGMKYVGDVMDISLLRMTILEDITLTSIMHNRRAGRIIFIPNNYIFTKMIANYTHSSLKTVWDGVKITITFESNHKRAMYICKEITRKYSKGYTDITRKQLNKLRHHYSLKNTNVDPRIFSFISPNGIDIEAWYLTNAYATLTLRSVISTEIIDAFKAEDDITIAYPTQKLHISEDRREELNSEIV